MLTCGPGALTLAHELSVWHWQKVNSGVPIQGNKNKKLLQISAETVNIGAEKEKGGKHHSLFYAQKKKKTCTGYAAFDLVFLALMSLILCLIWLTLKDWVSQYGSIHEACRRTFCKFIPCLSTDHKWYRDIMHKQTPADAEIGWLH